MPLAQARRDNEELGGKIAKGLDIEVPEAPKIPAFAEVAAEYVATKRGAWRSEKHYQQWVVSLATYCGEIAATPINLVDTEEVLRVLQPIWQRVPETARRLRGRIENILRFCPGA